VRQGRQGLDERRQALEEAFFRKEDERLLQELRQRLAEARDAEALAHACGLPTRTPALVALVHHGVRAETLPALLLAPLVAVAWADDEVSDLERLELMAHARELGVEPATPCHALLRSWLEHRPSRALFDAWREYARTLAADLDADQRAELEREVLWRAREVARADGGVLRLGRRVSRRESEMLDELAAAFGG
jgi:hypothetical protein